VQSLLFELSNFNSLVQRALPLLAKVTNSGNSRRAAFNPACIASNRPSSRPVEASNLFDNSARAAALGEAPDRGSGTALVPQDGNHVVGFSMPRSKKPQSQMCLCRPFWEGVKNCISMELIKQAIATRPTVAPKQPRSNRLKIRPLGSM